MDDSPGRRKQSISFLHGVMGQIIVKKWQQRHLVTTFLTAALFSGVFFTPPINLVALALSETVLVGISVALYCCHQQDIRADSKEELLGYTYDHIQQSDLNMEHTQFLEKPFSHGALLAAIRALKENSHECSSKR